MTKQLLSLLAIAAMALPTQAQSVLQARAATVGSSVTVGGIVTNGTELGNIRYLQDSTAGISIYGSNLTNVKRGDSITATGTLTSYNNLLEITPVTFTIITNAEPLPAPQVITPSQMTEPYESELVQINNCTFANGGATFTGNTNYNFTSSAQTGVLRITAGCPLVGTIIPNSPVNIVAILSQFCSTPASGCTTGYQLIPRDQSDIIQISSIFLTTQPVPTNILTTGMTINWTTNIAGTFYIKYGLTPGLELGTISGTGTSATPAVNITGATSATIYYAQVFSVNSTDTAKSLVKVFCTKSLSSGKISTYFTRAVDTTFSTGTNAIQNIAIPDTLAAYIGRAKSTIDLAIYNLDNSLSGQAITNSLNSAYTKGVKIRVVYDGSTLNSGISNLNAAIKKVASPQGSNYGIMHNKFLVIDANEAPNDAVVWTGSTNFTSGQLSTDANNVIIFQDQSLARGYKLEFDEMWGDSSVTSNPNAAIAKFGKFKTDNTPHDYIIGGKRVESYFSPSDGTNAHLISTIGSANTDLYFCQMLITRSDLANKVSSQKTLNSLTTKGILGDTTSGSTAYFILKNAMGAANLAIHKFGWIFHHKYLIIDPSNTASDPILLTGSHNWSNSAEQKNDENTITVHDAAIANIYYQEFNKRWSEQTLPPSVNLGADITQCGGPVILYAGNAGSTFAWSTGATTQNISVTASGTYSVTVTNANGSGSDTILVTIKTAPTVNLGPDVTQVGGTVTFDAGNAGSTYLWSNSATSQTITVSVSGTYSVTVTNTNGCTGTDTAIATISTGIEELNNHHSAIVFPNPADNAFSILVQSKAPYTGIEITDVLGKQLVSLSNIANNNGTLNVPDLNLAGGIYFVKVVDGEKTYLGKIAVK